MIEFHSFAASHFSEKARWALDWAGLPYREQVLLPNIQQLRSGQWAVHSMLPVLRHGTTLIQGATAILNYLVKVASVDDRLAVPATTESTLDWEHRFEEELGYGLGCIAYASLIKPENRQRLLHLWAIGAARWAPVYLRLVYPILSEGLAQNYGSHDPVRLEQAFTKWNRCLDRVDAHLAHHAFLGGSSPDRADLTLAAYLAPLAPPREHPVSWPAPPQDLQPFIAEQCQRTSVLHMQRMYRHYRHTTASPYSLGMGGSHVPRSFSTPPSSPTPE